MTDAGPVMGHHSHNRLITALERISPRCQRMELEQAATDYNYFDSSSPEGSKQEPFGIRKVRVRREAQTLHNLHLTVITTCAHVGT